MTVLGRAHGSIAGPMCIHTLCHIMKRPGELSSTNYTNARQPSAALIGVGTKEWKSTAATGGTGAIADSV